MKMFELIPVTCKLHTRIPNNDGSEHGYYKSLSDVIDRPYKE